MSLTGTDTRNVLLATLGFGVCALLPFADTGYWLGLGVTIAMFTALATSWALFSGPTHYISLATAAFFGVGTYVTGLGIETLPFWALVGLAGLIGAGLAALVGLATLRLSGVYFVIFTLGLAELVRQVITWVQNNTGQKGLYVLTDLDEAGIYWWLLGLCAAVFLTGWLIGRSRLGFALRIIGDDEIVAAHSGINTARAKILLFMVPGAVAAMTGAILAPRYVYIEPSLAFAPILSFQVVIMALLGGGVTALGASGRGDPVHVLAGNCVVQLPQSDDLGHRRCISCDRLSSSKRFCGSAGQSLAPHQSE
jgi:branched-chain amino acid transport system permease protein